MSPDDIDREVRRWALATSAATGNGTPRAARRVADFRVPKQLAWAIGCKCPALLYVWWPRVRKGGFAVVFLADREYRVLPDAQALALACAAVDDDPAGASDRLRFLSTPPGGCARPLKLAFLLRPLQNDLMRCLVCQPPTLPTEYHHDVAPPALSDAHPLLGRPRNPL